MREPATTSDDRGARASLSEPDRPRTRSAVVRWELVLLAAVLLLGAAVRLLYLEEIRQLPDFAAPAVDALFHDYWARGVATGDWTPPAGHVDPQVYAKPYFRPPGYPYFLGAVYAVTGGGYVAPRVVQMLLGLVNVVLAFRIGRRWFGRGAAILAAAAMAAYPVLVYFEGELHAPVLLVFLLQTFVLLIGRWLERPSFLFALAAGAVGGLAALVRPNVLALVAVAVLWTVWVAWPRGRLRTAGAAAIGLGIGCAIAVLPATVRNYLVDDDLVLISSNAGINLYIGNNERAQGLPIDDIPGLGPFRTCFDWPAIVAGVERRVGAPLKDSQVSAYFAGEARRFMREHPREALRLTGRKALLFWGPHEVGHNKEVHFECRFSRVLGKIPVTFAVVLALGLLGVGLVTVGRWQTRGADDAATRHRWQLTVLLVTLVAVYFLSVLPFFVAARYRLPIVPFLLVLGAFAVERCVVLLRARRWRAGAVRVVALAALLALTTRSFVDYEPSLARWHFDRGTDHDRIGDADRAQAHYLDAVILDPDFFEAHYNLGHKYRARGQIDDAILHWESALRVQPSFAPAHYNLALAYRDRGDLARAVAQMAWAVTVQPGTVRYLMQLGELLVAANRIDEARTAFDEVLTLDPNHYAATRNLTWILATHPDPDARDPARAVSLGERAARLSGGRAADALDALAAAYAAAGRLGEAVTTAREALAQARAAGQQELAGHIAARLRSYEAAAGSRPR